MDCISDSPSDSPTVFYLINRHTGVVETVSINHSYSFHYCNAFEDDNGSIHIGTLFYAITCNMSITLLSLSLAL